MNDSADDAVTPRDPLHELLSAQLKEQRTARRWRVFFRLSWLLLVLGLVLMAFNRSQVSADPSMPHTAMVQVRGEIGAGAETTAEDVVDALREAFEDPGAKAVVLRINSPGGSPVHAGIIHDEVRRLRAKHDKPVYAVVEETCASAAYYIAVATDQIFVDKASIVGSVGVLMDGFGFTGLMEKLGIERRLLTAGENKGLLDPFSPMNKTQRAHAQAMLDQIHLQFITVVREGRGDRLKETPETFSGLFWTGEQAVKLGLADELASLSTVAREVIKAEDIIDYTRRENVAERLVKRFGVAIGEGTVKALRSLTPIH